MNELAKTIFKNNCQKGFWEDRLGVPIKMVESGLFFEKQIESVKKAFIGQQLMLIVSELSEALEADRGRSNTFNKQKFEDALAGGMSFESAFQEYVKDSFQDEIADSLIRILDLCGGLNIDIDWHVEQKLKYNKTRSKMHGGKKY